MNRLDDVASTLPVNLRDNADYDDAEFVLLDYNSSDGLERWVRTTLMSYISAGRLVYYRTTQPVHYHMAHSRNVAFALASGDIVNNVDADNWTGVGFARRVNDMVAGHADDVILSKGRSIVDGRVGLSKRNWERIGGYDETFVGYGYDDKDLLNRALASGLQLRRYGKEYCRRIYTPDTLKLMNLDRQDKSETMRINRQRSVANILAGRLRANYDRAWATETVIKNFSDTIVVSLPKSAKCV